MKSIRQNKQFIAGCYARLSVEDMQDGTSVSIETQRKILTEYCKSNGIEIYDFYCDDGFTGTNFERPDFKRMIGDIEAGSINMVIVKDLSRFGRNYLEVGRYIDFFFPVNGIRFLAINESYDSLTRQGGFDLSLHVNNIINEVLPANTSVKVRQALKIRAESGEFLGSYAPYGYRKSRADKHVLEIDECASKVVERIFDLIANHGYGFTKIARQFSAEKILTPSAYRLQSEGKRIEKDPYDWNLGSVSAIVKNEAYLGNLVNGRRTTLSYKLKNIVKRDRDECIIVEGVIPQIINRDLWNAAQARVKQRKRNTKDESFTNIFAGLIRCDCCGHVLGLSGRRNAADEQSYYYVCEVYKKKGKDRCSAHYTRYNDVYDAVLKDVRSVIKAAKKSDPGTDEEIANALFGDIMRSDGGEEKRVAELEKQLAEIEDKCNKMYEDRLSGIITAERYRTYAAKEEERAKSIREEIETLNAKIKDRENADDSLSGFLEKVRSLGDVCKLDAALLNTLIDSITVGERYLIGEEYKQPITINYRFGR